VIRGSEPNIKLDVSGDTIAMPVPASVKRLIDSSGNSFHSKVARWFQSNGWQVEVSPYYMDQTQSKARELDLVVEKLWPINGLFDQHEGSVVVRLFVECKFVASEAVFWFTPKDIGTATKLVCSLGPFRENNTHTAQHHYIAGSPRVAKLFTSGRSRAQEADPFYRALNQSLNATVALRSRSPSHSDLAGRHSGKLVVLNYPVVVCSSFSQVYAADFLADVDPQRVRENFQLEVQYAYFDHAGCSRDELFLLDFVEFEQLPSYQTAIDADARAGAYLASSS
jgi:hypothetical protein